MISNNYLKRDIVTLQFFVPNKLYSTLHYRLNIISIIYIIKMLTQVLQVLFASRIIICIMVLQVHWTWHKSQKPFSHKKLDKNINGQHFDTIFVKLKKRLGFLEIHRNYKFWSWFQKLRNLLNVISVLIIAFESHKQLVSLIWLII